MCIRDRTRIFGIPVIKGAWTIGESTRVFSYTESVIPILLAVFVLMYLERALEKIIPQILQIILVPGISMILMVPLTLCLLGPVGIWAVSYTHLDVYKRQGCGYTATGF